VSESQTVSIENNVATGVGTNTDFLILSASSNLRVISNRASGMDAIAADAANSVVLYQHNAFSGYTEAGLEMSSDQNVTISGNQFVGGAPASAALLLGSLQNVLISDNTIQNGIVGVEAGGCRNIQISGNTVSNTQEVGLELGSDNTIVASGNTITRTGIGIETGGDTNMSLTGNQIAQCQQQGIFGGSDTGTETIFNNAIRSCGLAATSPPAVIFVDSPSATSISIIHNSYTGNTANLQFFIRCEQPQPLAQVSGNSTNTGLPTQVGP
jgi:parallel beta-helix repeat protein